MRKFFTFHLFMAVTGALLFGLSIHGIDLAVNYIHIGVSYGIPLVDKSPVGLVMTPEQIYVQSLVMLVVSFVLTILGVANLCRSQSEESRSSPRK